MNTSTQLLDTAISYQITLKVTKKLKKQMTSPLAPYNRTTKTSVRREDIIHDPAT